MHPLVGSLLYTGGCSQKSEIAYCTGGCSKKERYSLLVKVVIMHPCILAAKSTKQSKGVRVCAWQPPYVDLPHDDLIRCAIDGHMN